MLRADHAEDVTDAQYVGKIEVMTAK